MHGDGSTGLVCNVSSLVPAQRASFLADTSTVGSRGRPWPVVSVASGLLSSRGSGRTSGLRCDLVLAMPSAEVPETSREGRRSGRETWAYEDLHVPVAPAVMSPPPGCHPEVEPLSPIRSDPACGRAARDPCSLRARSYRLRAQNQGERAGTCGSRVRSERGCPAEGLPGSRGLPAAPRCGTVFPRGWGAGEPGRAVFPFPIQMLT